MYLLHSQIRCNPSLILPLLRRETRHEGRAASERKNAMYYCPRGSLEMLLTLNSTQITQCARARGCASSAGTQYRPLVWSMTYIPMFPVSRLTCLPIWPLLNDSALRGSGILNCMQFPDMNFDLFGPNLLGHANLPVGLPTSESGRETIQINKISKLGLEPPGDFRLPASDVHI